MKYVLSFLLGVLCTSIFFIYYLKNRLASTATPEVSTELVTTQDEEAPSGLPSGFRKFYENFHRDSIYQLTHIRFPLEGIPEKETEQTDLTDFYWKKDEWILHRPFNAMDGSFIRDFQSLGDKMVIEKIHHAEASFGMQRRFSRDGDEWYLIYYAAMNELAPSE